MAREGSGRSTQILGKGSKRGSWQVEFFAEGARETATLPETDLRLFNEVQVSEKESPLDQYDAYRLARISLRASTLPKESSEEPTLDQPDWSPLDLRDFLNGLLGSSATSEAVVETVLKNEGLPFRVREEDCGIYLRERFCQKLNYLLTANGERKLDKQLLGYLGAVREDMKALLLQAFLSGRL